MKKNVKGAYCLDSLLPTTTDVRGHSNGLQAWHRSIGVVGTYIELFAWLWLEHRSSGRSARAAAASTTT
jgi:hypothetical protein